MRRHERLLLRRYLMNNGFDHPHTVGICPNLAPGPEGPGWKAVGQPPSRTGKPIKRPGNPAREGGRQRSRLQDRSFRAGRKGIGQRWAALLLLTLLPALIGCRNDAVLVPIANAQSPAPATAVQTTQPAVRDV